ncbi:MAG: DUF3641 domain-containing protein [Chitinophagales bacterium]
MNSNANYKNASFTLITFSALPICRSANFSLFDRNRKLSSYMEKLIEAYNPVAASNVMCRNTVSIGWDGFVYDCDFNQMLGLKVADNTLQHVRDWNTQALEAREK